MSRGAERRARAALHIKNAQDFSAGLIFALCGAAFTWGATSYSVGTAARMGPGYFPLMLGGVLTLLGVILLIRSLLAASAGGRVGRIAVKPVVLVFAAIGAFALLLRTAGLVAAIFAIVLVSSRASHETRFKEALISAVVLCLAGVALFVYALDLLIPLWPVFLTP